MELDQQEVTIFHEFVVQITIIGRLVIQGDGGGLVAGAWQLSLPVLVRSRDMNKISENMSQPEMRREANIGEASSTSVEQGFSTDHVDFHVTHFDVSQTRSSRITTGSSGYSHSGSHTTHTTRTVRLFPLKSLLSCSV